MNKCSLKYFLLTIPFINECKLKFKINLKDVLNEEEGSVNEQCNKNGSIIVEIDQWS